MSEHPVAIVTPDGRLYDLRCAQWLAIPLEGAAAVYADNGAYATEQCDHCHHALPMIRKLQAGAGEGKG